MGPDWNSDGKYDIKDEVFYQSEFSGDRQNRSSSEYSGKGGWLVAYIIAMVVLTIFRDRWIGWIGLSLIFWPWYVKQ